MTQGTHRARVSAIARFGLSSLVHAAPALLVGLALAGGLWFGLLPALARLTTKYPSLARRFDPSIVDVLALALNLGLLVALLSIDRLRQRSRPSQDQRWE